MRPKEKDEFAAASLRHLDDAAILLARGRWDGSVYLAGYVAECALKWLVARSTPGLEVSRFSHDVVALERASAGEGEFDLLLALSTSGRPRRLATSLQGTDLVWRHPQRRYFPSGWDEPASRAAFERAEEVAKATTAAGVLNGVVLPPPPLE